MTPSAASEPLVITRTSNLDHILLDSLHDPANPGTLCTLSGGYDFGFISPMEIGYVTNSSSNDPINGTSTIGRMNLGDLKPRVVAVVQGDVMNVGWSPDGSSVAYLLYTEVPDAVNQLWLKTGSTPPRALTPPIPLFGRDGSPDDQIFVRFSPDGKYLLMVDTFVAGAAPASPDQAIIQVRGADGKLVFVPPSALGASGNKGGPAITMATWAHQSDRLYYRDPAGVHTWNPPSTVGTVAAAEVHWYSPTVSADDRYVAYVRSVGDNAFMGQPYVEIRDLTSSTVRDLPGIRSAPWFLSSNLLLEAEYGPNPQQGTRPSFVQTGSTFVYNLSTNAETPIPLVIDAIDSWPH